MTPITDAELAAWREARELATPGKYAVGARGPASKDELIAYVINCVECSPLTTFYLVWNPEDQIDMAHTGNGATSEANASFFALAANEWTRLLDALAETRAALAEAAEWIEDDDAERVADATAHLAAWRVVLGRRGGGAKTAPQCSDTPPGP